MANEEVLELQIRDNAADAAAGLRELSTALEKVKDAVGKGLRLKGVANQLETLKNAVNNGLNEDSVARFERLANVLERLKGIGALKISGIKNIANQMNVADSLNEAKEQAQEAANGIAGAIDSGMEEVESRTNSVGNTLKETFANAGQKVKDVVSGIRDAIKASHEKPGGFLNELHNGIDKARDGFKGMLSDFMRIVKYRMIRSIIKQITQAFTEGTKNVYFYSKAVGGTLAPAMDDAASILLQFKNSIGAAVSPLIQELIPVLKTVVEWAITGINWLNQLFSLLRGQSTWTKAIYKATDAFDDQSKKAKKAGKSIKDLLADWDELNIIQSESGGGGSGAAKAAEDYTKMFEEESKFDNWLSDHFRDVLDMIKMAGVALLGWKLSKNFTGVLGKLFKLVAGGAMVALGVKLSFESGFDAGLNGFKTDNILGMIGGVFATGLGGYMLTSVAGLGGGIGLAIGLGVGIVASLYGYMKGNAKGKDAVKWGNLHYTAEEVKKYVRDQFTFDVDANISVLHANTEVLKTAKDEADAAITKFESDLRTATVTINMDIDADPNGATVKNAVESAQEAVKSIQKELTTTEEAIEIGLKYLPYVDENGQDASSDLLSNIKVANEPIRNYMEKMGRDLANALYAGEKAGWDEGTKKAAIDLMKAQQEIYDEAERLYKQYEFESSLKETMNNVVKDGVIDKSTAEAALAEQEQVLKDYREAALNEAAQEASNMRSLAAKAEAFGNAALKEGNEETAKELFASRDQLLADAENRVKQTEKSIDTMLSETKENIRQQWIDLFRTIYGEDIDNRSNNYALGANSKWLFDWIDKGMKEGGISQAATNFQETIANNLQFVDPDGFVKEVLDKNGIKAFELLGQRSKEALYAAIENKYGTDTAYSLFSKAFDLTTRDIDRLKFNLPDNWDESLFDEIEDVDLDDEIHVPVAIEPMWDQFGDEIEHHERFVVSVDAQLNGASVIELYKQIQEEIDKADLIPTRKDQLTELLNSVEDYQTLKTLQSFIDNKGINEAFDMLSEYLNGSGWTPSNSQNTGRLGVAQLANTKSYSDSSYNPYKTESENPAQQTNEQMLANIESGMKNANEPQNELLRSMILQLTNLNNKQWNVNVYPSSTWGSFNSRSDAAWQNVTGG